MPKSFKTVVAALAIVILAVAVYNHLAFTNERKVRRTLLGLREKVSEPMTGGFNAVLTAATLKPLLAPTINISFQRGGGIPRGVFERDDVLRIITGIKQDNPKLTVKLDFSRRNIKIDKGGSATVSALTSIENFGEKFEPRRLTFTFEKIEKTKWQLAGIGEGIVNQREFQ